MILLVYNSFLNLILFVFEVITRYNHFKKILFNKMFLLLTVTRTEEVKICMFSSNDLSLALLHHIQRRHASRNSFIIYNDEPQNKLQAVKHALQHGFVAGYGYLPSYDSNKFIRRSANGKRWLVLILNTTKTKNKGYQGTYFLNKTVDTRKQAICLRTRGLICRALTEVNAQHVCNIFKNLI